MLNSDLPPPVDLRTLNILSARIGADPALIQAAGGNTSIKASGVMWIKASGTQLADAVRRDIMVPVDLERIRAALGARADIADSPAEFLARPGALRPSIETSLHAVFAQRVVVHVHCVNTIAFAIRADAETALTALLQGFDWGFVPYHRPGAQLAAQVAGVLGPNTNVVVLRNHGLIVTAESVAAAETLLNRVTQALSLDPGADRAADMEKLALIAYGTGFAPCPDAETHQLAFDPVTRLRAERGPLYPDHVLFCGLGATVLHPGETVADATARGFAPGLPAPVIVIVPDLGVLIPQDASPTVRALCRCLADVLRRVPQGPDLTYITPTEAGSLLNWDAETYRAALNAQ